MANSLNLFCNIVNLIYDFTPFNLEKLLSTKPIVIDIVNKIL